MKLKADVYRITAKYKEVGYGLFIDCKDLSFGAKGYLLFTEKTIGPETFEVNFCEHGYDKTSEIQGYIKELLNKGFLEVC